MMSAFTESGAFLAAHWKLILTIAYLGWAVAVIFGLILARRSSAATLAWTLALLALPLHTVRWEWKRFRRAFVYVATEVMLRSRQTVLRFNPVHRYVPAILQAHARLGP